MQKALVHWTDSKTTFVVYLLIGLYLLLFIPFWKPVLLGFLFAAALSPFVNLIRRKLHAKRSRVAYLTFALGLVFVIGLLILVSLRVYSQIYEFSQSKDALSGLNDKISTFRDQILSFTGSKPYLAKLHVREQIDKGVVGFTDASKNLLLMGAGAFVSRAPAILLNLLVFIVSFAAFLVTQPRLWTNISQALRVEDRGREHFERFEKICTLVLGSLTLVALLQSTLISIGAAIAGFSNIVTIFGISFFCSLIPVFGAGTVPIALMIYSFLQGSSSSGFIMLATLVAVAIADNVLRAWLFSRAAKSNPAISIITLLGGIALFGFPGLFIAPVIEQLVMTYAFSAEGEPKRNEVTAEPEPKQFEAETTSSSRAHSSSEPHLV